MDYQKHSVWEDEEKWDIHKSSYKGGGYKSDDKKEKEQVYKNEQQYGADKKEEEGIKSDYVRKEEGKEEEKKDKLTETVEQEEKYKNNKEEDGEHLQIKAAEEISQEVAEQPKKTEKRKNIKTIEDAITKAVKEEKEVVVLDK